MVGAAEVVGQRLIEVQSRRSNTARPRRQARSPVDRGGNLGGTRGDGTPETLRWGGWRCLYPPQYFNKNYNISVKFPSQ